MGEPSRPPDYRARRVHVALKALGSALGPRVAILGDVDPGPALTEARLVVRVVSAGCPVPDPAGGSLPVAVGARDALPIASGSLTGVLLAQALPAGDAAAPVLDEVVRLLQPGGFALLLARVAVDAGEPDDGEPGVGSGSPRTFAALAARLRAAALEPGRRIACHTTPSWTAARADAGRLPRPLWGVAAFFEGLALRWRLTHPAEVTCLVAARKRGGVDVDYPDMRKALGGLIAPPRWFERGRGRQTEG